MEVDRNGLEVLSRDECLRLLRTATLGCIGATSDAMPTVLPVNFRFDGRQILIRTGAGTKLGAATDNAVVADCDELRQPGARLVEHADGAVAGVDQVDGGLHDALQHGGQVEVAAHREDGVEQLAEAAGARVLAH